MSGALRLSSATRLKRKAMAPTEAEVTAMDGADALAHVRERFILPADKIYLDGACTTRLLASPVSQSRQRFLPLPPVVPCQ